MQNFQEYLWMQGLFPYTVRALLSDVKQYEDFARTTKPDKILGWLSYLK